MLKQFNKTDYLLWSIIVVYTGIIYATLSIVSKIRKSLVEKFGPSVFDHIYWFFGIIAAILLFYCFRKFKGKQLIKKLAITAVIACIYGYYLSGMKYPIERIHFLEYGLLGALILQAFSRQIKSWISIILSLSLVYWVGLGDEAIQGILASRVGEIRDCIINLFSGALGIALLWLIADTIREKGILKVKYIKSTLIFFGISTALTALFLYTIHGFGYCIERKDTGRFYSSLSPQIINKINTQSPEISPREIALYENEALRHLFQREFYFTNDFKAADGTFYRIYPYCFHENKILKTFYNQFLEKHATESSGSLITGIDREVAEKVMDNPVMWSDSLHTLIESYMGRGYVGLFSSRVKSGIITSYTLKDLLFYCILIFIILGYLWFQLPKRE